MTGNASCKFCDVTGKPVITGFPVLIYRDLYLDRKEFSVRYIRFPVLYKGCPDTELADELENSIW